MLLSYRPARAAELASCFRGLTELCPYSADIRDQVPELWIQWLRQGVLRANVFDRHENGRTTSVAFGATVFLRDQFIEEFRVRGRPYLREEIIRRSLAGEVVVLTPEMMREENRARGLTLLVMNDPREGRPAFTEEQISVLDSRWSEMLYELCGCRLNSIWHETYGAEMNRRVQGCGLRLYEDWADYWSKQAHVPPEHERPFLLGLTREQAKLTPGAHASFLFSKAEPQFDFSVRQQELLHEALQGATDDELAEQLKVSQSAVKKRWISVYDRVSDAMPGWLESSMANDARGSEKRRRLLNYLRQHPEELHPAWAARD